MNLKSYYPPMHSAEHILNGTMVKLYGVERSFTNHIERKKSKCDYKFDRNLTDDEVKALELKVNEIILQNLPITAKVYKRAEAMQLFDLDRLPDSAGEEVRIISVGNYDACPCSGLHVAETSEIGEFRITTVTHEEGALRIRFKLNNSSTKY